MFFNTDTKSPHFDLRRNEGSLLVETQLREQKARVFL